MRRIFLAGLTALCCTGAAPAPVTHSCDVTGWGSTPQVEVRAGPSPGTRMLAIMRQRAASEGGQEVNGAFPEFHIVAASNGWFRIEQASYGDYGDPPPRQRLFRGTGWVSGDRIGGQLYSGRLHTAPSEKSRSRPYGKEPDGVTIRRLLDCQGYWVKIEADIGTGWVHGLCGNQVTTCN